VTSWTQVTASVRQAIEQARDELNRLDAAAGDGDLGLTMTAAAQGAAALAERGELDGKPLAEALRALGRELARCAPSTSGTLLARGLLQAGREAGDHADDPPVGQAAALVRAGIAGIQKAGKAQPGDRTMLDALMPLAAALQDAADRGEPPAAATAAAAQAARAGAESTKDLEPKVGRASWIPDRARGNVDAGAHAVAIIAAAVATAVG
jgi:dihydroxyacetone kinase-like protein